MPFGWGANPNHDRASNGLLLARCHQCLSAGGLIQTRVVCQNTLGAAMRSPMPFGWGANPNGGETLEGRGSPAVTNAFRLGG